MKTEFDSSYPVHLNGIISPEEFQDSIARINSSYDTSIVTKIIGTIFGL